MLHVGIAALLIVAAGPSPAAAQQRSPFFSERQHPERVPGSENREIPEESRAASGTFLAIHVGAAHPLGTLQTPRGEMALSDVLQTAPAVAGEMAQPVTPVLGVGASVAWYPSHAVGGPELLTTLALHAIGRAQLRHDPWRAWIDVGIGGTYHRIENGRLPDTEEANLSLLGVAGLGVEVVDRWWIELTARYHRTLTGPADEHDVWGDDDPEWLLITVGIACEAGAP